MTGIEYPTISVGAHENLVVRLSLAAQLLMRRRGIDPAKFVQEMSPKAENPVQATITVFSCMVAENFLDLSKPNRVDLSVAPTADYWTVQIGESEDPQSTLTKIERAVWTSVGKVAEARRKLAVVPPTATEQAS